MSLKLSIALLIGGLLGSCTLQNEKSQSDASGIGALQHISRTFESIVGRTPSPDELNSFQGIPFDNVVTKILDSQAFLEEGYYHQHRDRLLIGEMTQTESRQENAYWDYCSMRLEMEDQGRKENGAGDYWNILRYKERWLHLDADSTIHRCLMEVPITSFLQQNDSLKGCNTVLTMYPALQDVFEKQIRPMAETAAGSLKLPQTENGRNFISAYLTMKYLPEGKVLRVVEEPVLREVQGDPSGRCRMARVAKKVSGTAKGRYYIKVEMPQEIAGIHANPYWLNSHYTSEKNRNLHRARLVYYSYFCSQISPDMAETGEQIQVSPDFEPFFDPEDIHVRKGGSCYECHKRIQPVANYFGTLNWGKSYDIVPELNYFEEKGFDRPGAYWIEDVASVDDPSVLEPRFFRYNTELRGMLGLADILSNHDGVQQCVIRSTWSNLFGRDYGIKDDEMVSAMAAFQNDGKASLTRLIKHLSLENTRGRAYFEQGPGKFEQLSQSPAEVIEVPQDFDLAATLSQYCMGCHAGFKPFMRDGALDLGNALVGEANTAEGRGELMQKILCRVVEGSMPPSYASNQLPTNVKSFLGQSLRQHRDSIAGDTIPESYRGQPCDSEVESPTNDLNNHGGE